MIVIAECNIGLLITHFYPLTSSFQTLFYCQSFQLYFSGGCQYNQCTALGIINRCNLICSFLISVTDDD
jgi:hypothetical protein